MTLSLSSFPPSSLFSLLPSFLTTHLPVHIGKHAVLARHILQLIVELRESGEEVPAPPLLVGARGLQALLDDGRGGGEMVVGDLGEEEMVRHVAVGDVVGEIWGREGGREEGREDESESARHKIENEKRLGWKCIFMPFFPPSSLPSYHQCPCHTPGQSSPTRP